MKIPYTVLGPAERTIVEAYPENTKICLPLLKYSLQHGKKKYTIKGLVDSGADISLYPLDMAELLEINLKGAKDYHLVGINGQSLTTKLHEVTMMYDRYTFKLVVGFSKAAVGARAFGAAGIVGHRGFFDRFKVAFNYKEQYFEINKRFSFPSIFRR